MKKLLLFILLFSIKIHAQKPITAILGAFSDEVKLLEDSLQNKQVVTLKGIRFLTGELRGRSVVVALTGVGKSECRHDNNDAFDELATSTTNFHGHCGGRKSRYSAWRYCDGEVFHSA